MNIITTELYNLLYNKVLLLEGTVREVAFLKRRYVYNIKFKLEEDVKREFCGDVYFAKPFLVLVLMTVYSIIYCSEHLIHELI